MLKIGNITFPSNVFLAPIAGHCNLPFRLVVRRCGWEGLAFTDLLCPLGIFKQNRETRWLMSTNDEDKPLGMQLYGNDPETMAKAAEIAVEEGTTTVDINMGCPVDKVTKTFAGSMMLCTPDATIQVVEAVVKAVGDKVPVTAKTRLGYCQDELSAPTLAKRMIHAGIQCLTIHGRTAHQRFKGHVDLEGIARVVEAVHEAGAGEIPCIGNGDIRTPFDAKTMMDFTGCDGVMIARASLGCPWLIRDTCHYLKHGVLAPELTLRQRVECVRNHYIELAAMREPMYAVKILSQKIAHYAKTMGHVKPMKESLRTLRDPDMFEPILDGFLDAIGEQADEVPICWAERAEQLGPIDAYMKKQVA